jgi:hypothetical protein
MWIVRQRPVIDPKVMVMSCNCFAVDGDCAVQLPISTPCVQAQRLNLAPTSKVFQVLLPERV